MRGRKFLPRGHLCLGHPLLQSLETPLLTGYGKSFCYASLPAIFLPAFWKAWHHHNGSDCHCNKLSTMISSHVLWGWTSLSLLHYISPMQTWCTTLESTPTVVETFKPLLKRIRNDREKCPSTIVYLQSYNIMCRYLLIPRLYTFTKPIHLHVVIATVENLRWQFYTQSKSVPCM